jgi:hypothetical protein
MCEFAPALTVHAIECYRSRIAPRPRRGQPQMTLRQAAVELAEALRSPLFHLRLANGGWLLGCRNRRGFRFLTCLSSDGTLVETCGPCWYWHEARGLWRQRGYDPNRNRPYGPVAP